RVCVLSSAVVPHRACATMRGAPVHRCAQQRVQLDARLSPADSAARPLGHRGVRSRLAIESALSRKGADAGDAFATVQTNRRGAATVIMLPDERRAELDRVQRRALVLGIVALAVCLLGAFFSPTQLLRSYLVAHQFFLGIALGGMAVLMIY